MLIVCPSTVWNPSALETKSTPKRMFGRILVAPRRGASFGVVMRLIFEMQVLRFMLPLAPFAVAMVIWPELALPIAQAPIVMLMIVGFVEMKVLALTPDRRETVISDADMARTLDALRFNAIRILTRIAAMRDIQSGEISLVIEQSELARITPLTLVSLQSDEPAPMVLDLSDDERDLLAADLFTDGLDEGDLHRCSLREGKNLRTITLDARTISAHARMAALLDQKRAAPPLRMTP